MSSDVQASPFSFQILTLFPEFFAGPLQSSLLGKAQEAGVLSVSCVDLRPFGLGKYRSADDKAYGGGPGMVMSCLPLEAALSTLADLDSMAADVRAHRGRFGLCRGEIPPDTKPWVVALSPQGEKWDAQKARLGGQALQKARRPVVFVCGHYEGIDERWTEEFVHEEISVGDFVLTGGEPAALCVLDSLSRFLPGVVGAAASVDQDTFEKDDPLVAGGVKYPVYTRPPQWRGHSVPEVLLSGDHGRIAQWRREQAQLRTRQRETLGRREPGVHPTEALGLPRAEKPSSPVAKCYLVLLHSPMLDRRGQVVATAVTNLDLHDLARSSRTYGVEKYYVVHPAPEQQRIVQAILGHWDESVNQVYHPARAQALQQITLKSTFQDVVEEISQREGVRPLVLMPDARDLSSYGLVHQSYKEVASLARKQPQRPLLLVLGTGWGPAPDFFSEVDVVLPPLQAASDVRQSRGWAYRHLSVRAAGAVILHRLFGES